jgi:ParB-like chromosome segregation protein Spo0J
MTMQPPSEQLRPDKQVNAAFEQRTLRVSVHDIRPLRQVPAVVKKSAKYRQIAASVRQVGVIEPPVVARDHAENGKYLLLDGHLRVEALKDMGETEIHCLVSTDDEGFTYNKRVNRLATIQEYNMIRKAIDQGVSEERIAKALHLNAKTIHQKKCLLVGICPETAELLKDKQVPAATFSILKKMTPFRQIEAAELMIALNTYSRLYAKSLLAATPQDQLTDKCKAKVLKGVTSEQVSLMEQESANLEREFRLAEKSYGTDHLDLVLAKGYVGKLLSNAKIVRFLAQHYSEILAEFQKIADLQTSAP